MCTSSATLVLEGVECTRGNAVCLPLCLSIITFSFSKYYLFFPLRPGGDLLRSVLRIKMKSNSSSKKIVKVSANNNRFRVTFHGTIQPFTSLDSTDILKSFEIFDVTLHFKRFNHFHDFFFTSKHWPISKLKFW